MLSAEELEFYFRVYNPEKATPENIARIIAHFEKHPEKLSIKLGAKYGQDPEYFCVFSRQLISFFHIHNPSKATIKHVLKIMREFKGNRAGLCKQLQDKYGADPQRHVVESSDSDCETDSDEVHDIDSTPSICASKLVVSESPDAINSFIENTSGNTSSAKDRRTAQYYIEGAWKRKLGVQDAIAYYFDRGGVAAPESWTTTIYAEDWYTPAPAGSKHEEQGVKQKVKSVDQSLVGANYVTDLLDFDFETELSCKSSANNNLSNNENRDNSNSQFNIYRKHNSDLGT